MRTFYFNTGVRPESGSPLCKGQIWKGGVKQIPFDCEDVPDGSKLLFCCNDPKLDDANREDVIVRSIHNTTLCSKYAYFRLPYSKLENAS